jgi:hypothetical protein
MIRSSLQRYLIRQLPGVQLIGVDMKIMKCLMATAAVLGFGLTFLGALLGLVQPLHAFILSGFFMWAVVYATACVDI